MDSPRRPLFYEFGGFRLDTVQRLLIGAAGDAVPLSARVFETLLFLLEHAGELVDKSTLMKTVWPHVVVEENNLNQSISALRRLFGEAPGEHRFIVTVPGRGYRFVAPVVAHSTALAPLSLTGPREEVLSERAPSESLAVAAASQSAEDIPPRSRRLFADRLDLAITLAALICVSAGSAWLLRSPPAPPTQPSEYLALTDFSGSASAPALSPDGRTLAFIEGGSAFMSSGQIYVQSLPDGAPRPLTDSHSPKYAPTFTPDGSRIAYTLIDRGGEAVSWDTWTVPVTGGASSRLLPNASGLTWLDDRTVLYSEISTGLHMGIVTATVNRAEHREVYFPAHERAMAHFSYPSPDRKWVLIVEMDRTSAWLPCRLVSFGARAAGHAVGPAGRCRAAAWSPNGEWMYFSVEVAGHSHLWRQRLPSGPPEQITFGPTDEEGVIATPDGKALITSIGFAQSALWIHDSAGERALSSEGFVSHPWLSADGRRAYFLSAQHPTMAPELRSVDIGSGQVERWLPGFSMTTFAISGDERDVAFSTSRGGELQVWLAPLDHHAPPRLLARGGDQVAFDANGRIFFRALGASANYLDRIGRDGAQRERVLDTPILNFFSVSPDGKRVALYAAPKATNTSGETLIVDVDSAAVTRIQSGFAYSRWSADGRFFYRDGGGVFLDTEGPGKTLVYEVAGNGDPFGGSADPAAVHEAAVITRPADTLFPGPDPSTYAFLKRDLRRNLFRIPIH